MDRKRKLHRTAQVLVTTLLTAALSLPAGAAAYLDVAEDDWCRPAVAFTVEQELFTGVDENYFAPQDTMTRAMFYVVLSRAADVTVNNAVGTNLTDVPAGQWYTGAVVWALSQGIATCEGNAFGINAPVTRAEICLALARYDATLEESVLSEDEEEAVLLELAGTGASADGTLGASGMQSEPVRVVFQDLSSLDQESREAINACATAGVIRGRNQERFAPEDTATRAEVAQLLQNYYRLGGTAMPGAGETILALGDVSGWTGEVEKDFPLSQVETVTPELVNWLNQRIIAENQPKRVAAFGTTLDGNPKHLTNYGTGGLADCIAVKTILDNSKNNVHAGVQLAGRQEYYGYTLQTEGIAWQDEWHQQAMLSGKDPWQCTWWAWGRAAQYLDTAYGLDFKTLCNGKDNLGNGEGYYRNLTPYFRGDKTPAANSLISWSGGDYGHVAYVEAVDENGIWVSSADAGHAWRGITYIVKTNSTTNPYPLFWYSGGERLNGFIHLDYAADGSPIGS